MLPILWAPAVSRVRNSKLLKFGEIKSDFYKDIYWWQATKVKVLYMDILLLIALVLCFPLVNLLKYMTPDNSPKFLTWGGSPSWWVFNPLAQSSTRRLVYLILILVIIPVLIEIATVRFGMDIPISKEDIISYGFIAGSILLFLFELLHVIYSPRE